MKSTLRLGLLSLWVLMLGCKLDDLPANKRLKTCVKPNATIVAVVDPTNYLKYTFSLSSDVTGDVTNVVWKTIGNRTATLQKAQSWENVTFTQAEAGTVIVTAELQNTCNTNTTVQRSLNVTPGTPSVVTGAVINTGSTTATVSMTVTSLGGAAGLSEYGILYAEAPNNDPQRQNSFQSVSGAPTLNTPISVTLNQLKPNTKYYYRAYAKNDVGKPTTGSVIEFTTASAASNSRLFGGSQLDFGYFMVSTASGGGIFVGNSNSNNGDVPGNKGSYDAWVVRYDANGVVLWKKNYGGSSDDNIRSIQFTTDGNVVLVGHSNSTDGELSGKNKGGYDVWVMKLNASSGDIIWHNTYGGSKDEFGQAVQATSDGGCILVGRTVSDDGNINTATGRKGGVDIWVVKLKSDGIIEWQRAYGGSGEDRGQSIQTTRDGGYVVAGSTTSNNNGQVTNFKGVTDGWVFKLKSNGDLDWQTTLGTAGNDEATCVQQTSDNQFIVTGFMATSITGNRDVMVAKLNLLDGSVVTGFPNPLGGFEQDQGNYIEQTQDGGFILVASTNSRDVAGLTYQGGPNQGGATDNDIWIIKLKADGKTTEWQKTVGGSADDQSFCIRPVSPVSDGYVLVGTTGSTDKDGTGNKGATDVIIVKIPLDGGK